MSLLAALRSVGLRAVPTANRFAALSISSGVTLALLSTVTALLGQVPRMSLRHMAHAAIAVLLLASPPVAQPELDSMFVEEVLMSDQATAAPTRSPDVGPRRPSDGIVIAQLPVMQTPTLASVVGELPIAFAAAIPLAMLDLAVLGRRPGTVQVLGSPR